jgi:hypothetical protein
MKPLDKLKELYLSYSKIKNPSLPDYARCYPPYFSKSSTTNGLTKCIIAYIRLNGWQAERISTTGRIIDKTKIVTDSVGFQRQIGSKEWIKGTGTKGSGDISATISGKSIKIEIKNEKTKDRQSIDQKKYELTIDFSGGIYYIAKNFNDFVTWFDENFKQNENLTEIYNLLIKNGIVI